MKNIILKILNNKKLVSYIIIFLLSVFICIPLFSKYMDISRDDGIQHISRLIGTSNTIKEIKLFPVIMSEFCNGFGYSWNIFYSPLTAYLPLIFKLITSSFVLCLKLFMFFTMFLSGIYMYKLVYAISKSNKAAIISAIIYIIAPYHLTDLYDRIAIAELASFVFLPIVFLGMYNLFNKQHKKSYYIAIGAIGLILSHNVIAIYTAIFCCIYLLANFKKLNKVIFKNIIINITIILLCTSFYWIPLLEHYFATTYEVFIPGRMYSNDTLISFKLDVSNLIYAKQYGVIYRIGLPIILGTVLAYLYRKKINKTYKKTLIIFICFGIASIIMTLKIFPFEYLPSFLKMIQFQWRMLEFANFFLSIIAGISINIFLKDKRYEKNINILLVMCSIIYISILLVSSTHKVKNPIEEEKILETTPITSWTGKIHTGCATFEYLPQKALKNRKYIEQRSQDIYVIEGKANILNQSKENTNLRFNVEKVMKNTKLELPYIFYLGYNIELTDNEGNKTKLDTKESENGFVMIEVSNIENGKIEVKYTGTFLMKISYFLTFAGIITIILAIYRTKPKK